MKVSRGASHSLQQAQSQAEMKGLKGKNKNQKSAGVQSSLSAQVSLSDRAQQVKKATDIAKEDRVDEKKIAMFQNLIDSGKYQVDSAKVADRLIDDHMKMPS